MVELSLSFDPTPVDFDFTITDAAASRITKLMDMEGRTNQAMRVKVIPGGCAGFQYEFSWVSKSKITDEKLLEKNNAGVVFGQADLRHVNGGTLDYIENLAGSKFEISNPNATSTCGCGKSFA